MELKKITKLSESVRSCLGVARARELKKLIQTGFPVTGVVVEEYTQMTISECRQHVIANRSAILSAVPKNIHDAARKGFALDYWQTDCHWPPRGRVVYSKKNRAGQVVMQVSIPFRAKFEKDIRFRLA